MGARVRWLIEASVLFLAYFASAKAGLALLFDPVGGLVSLVWPPTGLALAALVLRGQRLWPAVALGALAINLVQGAPPLAAVGMALGNTAEAVIGAWLLARAGVRPSLDGVRDVVAFVPLAAGLSTAVSATVGVASLWLSGKTSAGDLTGAWRTWWLGDAIGDLVVAPLLLVLGSGPRIDRRPRRVLEALLLAASLASVSLGVLAHTLGELSRSFPYLVFPFLVWAGLRFGQVGGTSATLVVAMIAVGATVRRIGPFLADSTSAGLLQAQLFVAVVALTVLLLCAALSERRRAIEERERANAALAARNEELSRSNRELEDFTTVASHDLQEPLRKVHLYVDRLAHKLGISLDDEAREHLERVVRASDRVQKLIDDLFAFARVKSRTEPFVRVDLSQIARSVVDDLEAAIVKEQGRVQVGPLPSIDADPVQMRQLLQNLVGNALKFHRPHVPPVVSVRADESDARTVKLLVEDNGIGFEERYLEKIFTLFHRLHGRDEYAGSGVGLAICRRIVERHGGTITARSRLDEGSTFIVTIPRGQS